MQGCPTVIPIYMHSPQVEYAGVPHSGARFYALPTVEYAGLPHRGTRLQYMHSPQVGGDRPERRHGYTRIRIWLVMRDLSNEVWLSTNAKQQMELTVACIRARCVV
jgi:hypothetical protein